jgi:N12 class adenine-specific DNA methylase
MDPKKPAPYAQKWSDVDETYTRDGGYPTRVPINEYYKKHPENMLGKVTASGMYGSNDRLSLDGEGVDVAKDLQKCLNKMPKEIFDPVRGKKHDTVKADNTFLAEAGTRDHAYLTKDGKAYQNIGGVNTPVPKAKQNLVKDFCQLRSALNSVLRAQIDPKATDTVIAKLRNDLNKVYDSFVAKHGYVNKQTNASYLSDDPMYGQTAAVEKYKKEGKVETASKTDIFSKRTVGAITEATSAASPEDALAVSISQHGRVDIPYMANLLGQTEDDVVKSLEGTLYHDPADSTYKLAEEYLSGNVRLKLAQAEMAAKTDPTYHDNVEALKRVQPADMKETDINAHLGAPWISPEIISDFTAHMVGKKFDVSRDGITGRWSIGKNTWGADQTAMTNKWGSRKMDFRDLLERILGMKDIVVTGTDSEGHKYTDEGATAALNQKAQDIQDEFGKWLWTDEKRKTDLLDTYNKLFNSDVERQYDGSSPYIPRPGITCA